MNQFLHQYQCREEGQRRIEEEEIGGEENGRKLKMEADGRRGEEQKAKKGKETEPKGAVCCLYPL